MTAPLLAIKPWLRTACISLLSCCLIFPPLALGQSDQEREAQDVARLLSLITRHHEELEESRQTQPSAQELALRNVAQRDAESLAKIPFSIDKVRLNGSEGNTALAQMTQRLSNPQIPESRRDISLICSIKTHLFGSLIASENRSLKPAGKNQYIAKVRLQPGQSTMQVGNDRWQISLPQDMNATDYLITLYTPPGGEPEFHVFSVTDLLEEKQPHIPAWLPPGIKLNSTAG